MKLKHTLGFIGAGNMGEALIRGLFKARVVEKKCVFASDRRRSRVDFIRKNYQILTTQSNLKIVNQAEIIIFCVKPQVLKEVILPLKKYLSPHKLIISIAAGVPTKTLETLIDTPVPLVRAMPNLPGVIGEGITAICGGRYARAQDLRIAKTIFQALGEVLEIDEHFLDAVTAISGSGPAYVFYFAESLIAAARELGFSQEVAEQLTFQTLRGSALMLGKGKESAQQLRTKISSPGGTTVAALKVLAEGNFPGLLSQAIKAAFRRSQELSQC
jgi:pyrroline-5-carboxylate reductase